MSYATIKAELERAINEIHNVASTYSETSSDECNSCYGQGLEDATNYLEGIVTLASELAQDERHSEISNRVIKVPEKQLELFSL